jgi:hypothetical protein
VVVARILGLAALLAGCLEPNIRITDAWPVDRPVDWDRSPELVAYDGFRSHSADQEVAAAPEEQGTPEPAGCAAYQDGKRDRLDTCEVHGPDTRFGRDEGPWTIHATWDGRGEDLIEQERDESRRTVVAYAADGAVVAHLKAARAFAVE